MKPARAGLSRRECPPIRAKKGPDGWRTFKTQVSGHAQRHRGGLGISDDIPRGWFSGLPLPLWGRT
jgi:hypothetical protein